MKPSTIDEPIPVPQRDRVSPPPAADGGDGNVKIIRYNTQLRPQGQDGAERVETSGHGSASPSAVRKRISCPKRTPSASVQKIAARLKEARIAAGYKTAAEFARAHGITPVTYQHQESGIKPLTMRRAARYAEWLATPATTLLFGGIVAALSSTKVVGYITESGGVQLTKDISDHRKGGRHSTIPTLDEDDLGDLVAYQVKGNHLWPAFWHGSFLFHRPLNPDTFKLRDAHGHPCIVQLENGRILVALVTAAGGKATLNPFNGPPMEGVRIRAAEPIRLVKPWVSGPVKLVADVAA